MATIEAKTTYTPDDLLLLPDSKDYELVDGLLVERHMGAVSSWVGGRILAAIHAFLEQNPQGWVWPADNSYQCFPDSTNTVRKPDVSFIQLGRLPGERLPAGHVRIAPDLVVEVLSPHDLAYEVDEKLLDYFSAGVRLVWLVNPESRRVRVYRIDGTIRQLTEQEFLDGEDVLPGFRCPISQILPPTGS